jgi:hypothetical protein
MLYIRPPELILNCMFVPFDPHLPISHNLAMGHVVLCFCKFDFVRIYENEIR